MEPLRNLTIYMPINILDYSWVYPWQWPFDVVPKPLDEFGDSTAFNKFFQPGALPFANKNRHADGLVSVVLFGCVG